MTRTYENASAHRNAAALSRSGSASNSDVESVMATLDAYLNGIITGSEYAERLQAVEDGLTSVYLTGSNCIYDVNNSDMTFRGIKTIADGIKFSNEVFKYYNEGSWTLADASGDATPAVASSSLSRYVRFGNVVYFSGIATYISNASATNAKISGPPYTVIGANRTCHIWTSATTFSAYGELVANGARTDIQFWRRIPLDLPNHQRVTNADLSSKELRCYGMFFVA